MPEESGTLVERFFEGFAGFFTGFFSEEPFTTDGFRAGLLLGLLLVLAILLLVLVVWLVMYWARRRHLCRGIPVQGEDGDLFITVNAMREFVVQVVGEFAEASLASVVLLEKEDSLVLDIALSVRPDTHIVPLVELLRERIMTGARERMGVGRPLKVNVSIGSLSAKERKGPRSPRAVSKRAAIRLPDEAPGDGATEGAPIPTPREPVPLE